MASRTGSAGRPPVSSQATEAAPVCRPLPGKEVAREVHAPPECATRAMSHLPEPRAPAAGCARPVPGRGARFLKGVFTKEILCHYPSGCQPPRLTGLATKRPHWPPRILLISLSNQEAAVTSHLSPLTPNTQARHPPPRSVPSCTTWKWREGASSPQPSPGARAGRPARPSGHPGSS